MSETAAVRWPSYCDLCDEYTTTPERCSHCGHPLRPLDPSPVEVPRSLAVPPPTPFADVAREARVTHQAVLAELASWALAQGRRVDLDVAAVALDVLEEHRTEDGIRLDRQLVSRVTQSGLHNRASMVRALMPDT